MSREPPEPLQLDYLIKAGAIHSMTGGTYRSMGVRGAEIVVVSADPDGLDDLVGGGTAVVDAGELTLLPAFADSHEHLMEASRNTLLVPVDQARSMAEFTGMVGRLPAQPAAGGSRGPGPLANTVTRAYHLYARPRRGRIARSPTGDQDDDGTGTGRPTLESDGP